MDILFGDIVQVDAIDFCGVVDIFLHSGRGGDVLDCMGDFTEPAAVLDSELLHRGRDGKTEGVDRPFRVRDHQVRRHGVQTALGAFHRGVERF